MSNQERTLRDGESASFTNESLNQEETNEVHVIEPRVTRNSARGRRGNPRRRSTGQMERPRSAGPSAIPTANLTEQITQILMSTLPTVLGQLENNRRAEEQERLAKEAEEQRVRLEEEARIREEESQFRMEEERRKHEEDLQRLKEEIERLKSGNAGMTVSTTKGCSYKEFMGSKPPDFSGKCDPIAAANWVSEMEMIFAVSECTEEKKVLYSTVVLKGKTLHWWKMIRDSSNGEIGNDMSWATFKVLFMEKFSSRIEIQRLEEEFLKLSQENLTVQEYATKFIERARFVRRYAATEEDKVSMFVDGLRYGIRGPTTMSRPQTLLQAIESACMAERELNRSQKEKVEGK